ncbi:zinc finger protein 596-like [Diabrotica virgifera virgifera]|uniref:C2H2-type domain-containing protein n=1 Tax=Diabrotica virgifera virgifera TaxID=50390 RepID=A0ABM5JMY9_DIAVI|nr:zinc finger protein 596-like [Diabrotica virgifera virgifera]
MNTSKVVECLICGKTFSSSSNVRKHVKKLHPDRVLEESYDHIMNTSKVVKCSICKKTFSTSSNLKKHAKKFHPDTVLVESYYKNSKHFNFTCECGRNFNHIRHLKSHRRKVHLDEQNNILQRKCPLCDFSAREKSSMLEHFQKEHNICVDSKEYTFSNIQQFEKWKTDLETKSCSRYIKKAKSVVSNSSYYCCHRSGNYTPKDDRVRRLKGQGSNKINAYCPASIRLIKNISGSCTVTLIDTHVGHDFDLEHLQLTDLERKDLAVKIASGMNFDEIIQQIKKSADPDSNKRLHLVTKRDLRNIEACFNRHSGAITKSKKDINKFKGEEQICLDLEATEIDTVELGNGKTNENLEETKKRILKDFSDHLHKVNSTEELESLEFVLKSHYNSLVSIK